MSNMKLKWSTDDVIGYIEGKMISGISTNDEEVLYEEYSMNGKLPKCKTLRYVLDEMREAYWGN